MISGAAAVTNQKRICPGPKQLGPKNLLRARHSRCAVNVPMSGIGSATLGLIVWGIILSPIMVIGYVGYRFGKRTKS